MAKQTITIALTFEYDPAENNNMPVRNFLYHFLQKFNREYTILEVAYKGKKFDATKTPLDEMPLKKVDSLDIKDLPKKPSWLKDRTVLSEETNRKVAARMQAEAEENKK